MFNYVFVSGNVLAVVSIYWIIYALVGHKLTNRTVDLCLAVFSLILTALGFICVGFFFV